MNRAIPAPQTTDYFFFWKSNIEELVFKRIYQCAWRRFVFEMKDCTAKKIDSFASFLRFGFPKSRVFNVGGAISETVVIISCLKF